MLALFLLIILASLLAVPELTVRWLRREGQAHAEAAYLKRQAELKAEAEAAERRLGQLDKRIQFISLGFREVARRVAPVVVNVTNEKEIAEGVRGRVFFDLETKRSYEERGEGSGIIIKPGFVMTNHHVVRDADRLRVIFPSGKWVIVKSEGVYTDALTDLAVLRLPQETKQKLQRDYEVAADFADSDKDIQVGDWVLAAGSPFGLKQSLTAGIVSAKGRVELGIVDQVELIQTDAALNPGNSGGPLFDQQGRVVGINVAIASQSGGFQGIGFAIPSNSAREIFTTLVEKGEVVRGFLGIGMQEVPIEAEQRLGISETGGVIVTSVGPTLPADQAGIRSGDVIVRYNQESVGPGNAMSQLRHKIAHTEPGATVPVEILRNRKKMTFDVTVIKRPADLNELFKRPK